MIPSIYLGMSYRYYVAAGNPDNFVVIDRGNGPVLEGEGAPPDLTSFYVIGLRETKKDQSRNICRTKLSELIHPLTNERVTDSKVPSEIERRLNFAQGDCIRYQGDDKAAEIAAFFTSANDLLAKNETIKAEIDVSDPENFDVAQRWEQ